MKIKHYNIMKTPFLSRVKLEEAKSTLLENNTMYRQLVCCILYLTHIRPDTSYVVSVESRHMEKPHDIHWREENKILHFVQGTKTHGIHYVAKSDLDLVGFTDSDWASDSTDRK